MSNAAPENLDEYEGDLEQERLDDALRGGRVNVVVNEVYETDPSEIGDDVEDAGTAHVEPTPEEIAEMDGTVTRGRI